MRNSAHWRAEVCRSAQTHANQAGAQRHANTRSCINDSASAIAFRQTEARADRRGRGGSARREAAQTVKRSRNGRTAMWPANVHQFECAQKTDCLLKARARAAQASPKQRLVCALGPVLSQTRVCLGSCLAGPWVHWAWCVCPGAQPSSRLVITAQSLLRGQPAGDFHSPQTA